MNIRLQTNNVNSPELKTKKETMVKADNSAINMSIFFHRLSIFIL